MTTHSLTMLVHADVDVLSRTVVLFATRGVEVRSLTFQLTGQLDTARLDIVVGLAEGRQVTQLIKQLHRLVDVVTVNEQLA